MPTGKLAISRGHGVGDPAVPKRRLSSADGASVARGSVPRSGCEAAVSVAPEYKPVHDRLSALERLAKLRDLEILTEEEFLAEKAHILGHQAEELVLNEPLLATETVRGPSLLARMLSWKFVPVGLAAGIALSYASQPSETMRFFDDALRLLGA
jgi:hypothetical protein